MWFPVDFPMPNEHFSRRTLTPQVTGPQTKSMQLPVSWRTQELKSAAEQTQNGQTAKTETRASIVKRNMGIAMTPAAGIWFSALFNEEVVAANNIPETGNWRRSGLWEEFRLREVVARTGFDLRSNLQMGLGLRAQSVRADVLGSFSASPDDRVVYSGSRLGMAAAVLANVSPVQISVRFETPVSGKVDIQGESKVSSTSGYTGAAAQLAINSDISCSAVYGFYQSSKNELANSTPSPNKSRRSTIVPIGMAVDARTVPLSVLGAGANYRLSSAVILQADAVRGTVYASNDPELLVPDTVSSGEKQPVNVARLGVSVEKSDWESQVFIDYATSKVSYTANSASVSRTMSYWGVGLRAGIEL
ncbi:MAG: hypothetical protein RIR26_598 [Pseudomonadota bacterium]|jgi:hypothetical protein